MIRYLHIDRLAPAFAKWLRHRACFFRGPRIGYGGEKFTDDHKCTRCGYPRLVIYC